MTIWLVASTQKALKFLSEIINKHKKARQWHHSYNPKTQCWIQQPWECLISHSVMQMYNLEPECIKRVWCDRCWCWRKCPFLLLWTHLLFFSVCEQRLQKASDSLDIRNESSSDGEKDKTVINKSLICNTFVITPKINILWHLLHALSW